MVWHLLPDFYRLFIVILVETVLIHTNTGWIPNHIMLMLILHFFSLSLSLSTFSSLFPFLNLRCADFIMNTFK